MPSGDEVHKPSYQTNVAADPPTEARGFHLELNDTINPVAGWIISCCDLNAPARLLH